MATPRIYLTGHVSIEHDDRLVAERDMPGRQGRLAFVFLAANRDRLISRGELTDVIWADQPPYDADAALNPILSKLRRALRNAGWSPSEATIDGRSGSVGIRFPPQTWVDIEDAVNAVDEAEGALRRGNPVRAWGFANVVVSIARRPFLADHDAPWIEARRGTQRTLLTRGLECLAAISASSGEPSLAVQYFNEILDLEPLRETAYQHLMRLHAGMGNGAEALRVFGRCRDRLRNELGASPSPQTEAAFLEILRAVR